MEDFRNDILNELERNVLSTPEEEIDKLIEYIDNAKKIFVYGRGREMMAISMFCTRLSQMGYKAYIVAEAHVPPIKEGDLLLVSNCRNMIDAHELQMRAAKRFGAKVVVFTSHPNGGFMDVPVDYIVHVSGQTLDDPLDKEKFYQTMGSASEQNNFLIYESAVVKLMQKHGISKEEIKNNYTNLI